MNTAMATSLQRDTHICPPWVGYLLASPLRSLLDDTKRLFNTFVEPGMTVLDLGPGMGFHSLPLARLVGPTGRVISPDVQDAMVRGLRRRARRKGLADRIDARVCAQDDLGLADVRGQVDFALAINVVHEMTNPDAALRQVHEALRPGGRLLVAEPLGHLSEEERSVSFDLVAHAGFARIRELDSRKCQAALYQTDSLIHPGAGRSRSVAGGYRGRTRRGYLRT